MTDVMVEAAFAPFAPFKPKTTKTRRAAAPKAGRTLGAVVSQLRAARSLKPGVTAEEVSPRIPKGAQYLAD